jgi:hypothetical protein
MIIFYLWGVFNLLIGIWEIYIFSNRKKLKLEKRTVWDKIKKGDLKNFFIEGWAEYCKVDSRYIYNDYVWTFELLNAFLAIIFLPALILKKYKLCKIILILMIINCVLYFITLFIELVAGKINTKYAKWWMFPIYYFISAIWIIFPIYLLILNK